MYHNIEPLNSRGEINVIIEILAQAPPVKYEIDKNTGLLTVDRFLSVSMSYPCNYGFIPNTLSKDNDPVDVLVITSQPLVNGCIIKCKPVAVLLMEDESGEDEKVIAVPCDGINSGFEHINDYKDIPENTLNKIKHFFERYKDLDVNKWVKVTGFKDKEHALQMIREGIDR